MGASRSKIPAPYPGQLLKLTGISEIDEKYIELENIIRKLKRIRMNIDFRLTDFILQLGSGKLWERNPNFKEILRMFILVLVINHEKKQDSIEKLSSYPYLGFDTNKCSYSIKNLYECFEDYIKAVEDGVLEIKDIDPEFQNDEMNNEINHFSDLVLEKTAEEVYKTEEKLLAVENVNSNQQIIKETIKYIGKIQHLKKEIINDIGVIVDESKKSHKIIQRSLQAKLERIYKPADIIRKFWPYPLP